MSTSISRKMRYEITVLSRKISAGCISAQGGRVGRAGATGGLGNVAGCGAARRDARCAPGCAPRGSARRHVGRVARLPPAHRDPHTTLLRYNIQTIPTPNHLTTPPFSCQTPETSLIFLTYLIWTALPASYVNSEVYKQIMCQLYTNYTATLKYNTCNIYLNKLFNKKGVY